MFKTLAIIFASAFLALSGTAFAEETGPAVGGTVYCPQLTSSFQINQPAPHATDANTGGQVSQLQHFLSDYYDINPGDSITGFFGNVTRTNVRRFQCEAGVACSGDESTTGWGRVGAMTRAVIASHCGGGTSLPKLTASPTSGAAPLTVSFNASVSGEVQFGDGQSDTLHPAPVCSGCVPVFTTGHVYAQPGTYTARLLSEDSHGVVAATQVITVTARSSSCTFNSQTIADGASVTAYLTDHPGVAACVSQVRTCTNGTLSGTYQYSSCTPVTTGFNAVPTSGSVPLAVTFTGVSGYDIDFGDGHGIHSGGAPLPTTVQYTYPVAGRYSATNAGASVMIVASPSTGGTDPISCMFNGQTIANGASVTAYLSPARGTAQALQCVSETRVCTNGVLSGSYTYSSCTAGTNTQPFTASPTSGSAPLDVTFTNVTGSSMDFGNGLGMAAGGGSLPSTIHYTYPSAGAFTATNNGSNITIVVSSPSTGGTDPLSCTFNGQTIANGNSVVAYQFSTTQAGADGSGCVSEVRICHGGALTGSYPLSSCNRGASAMGTRESQLASIYAALQAIVQALSKL